MLNEATVMQEIQTRFQLDQTDDEAMDHFMKTMRADLDSSEACEYKFTLNSLTSLAHIPILLFPFTHTHNFFKPSFADKLTHVY